MISIKDRYKSLLKTDVKALAKGQGRRFVWLLSTLGIEYAHGKLYELALGGQPEIDLKRSEYFGTPMWDNLIIDPDGDNLIIDMVLMDVSMTKNIIKTPIQGMNGTIKEYISDGDYIINIKGALFGIDEYPAMEVLKLITLCKRPEKLRVLSAFLQNFDIDDIVIESYTLEAQEAQGNMQFFELNAISDMATELVLSSNSENTPVT